jgi:hypothetical protein
METPTDSRHLLLGAPSGRDCFEIRRDCDNTVAELEACAAASPGYMAAVAAVVPSCAEVRLADVQSDDLSKRPARPTACAPFGPDNHCSDQLPFFPQ